MTSKVVSGVLAADVADSGTFTVNYPAQIAPESGTTDEGDFFDAMGHKFVLGQNNVISYPQKFDITLGTASITVTNKTGSTWLAGTSFKLQLDQPGKEVYTDSGFAGAGTRMARMTRSDTFLINFGSPDALVTNGVMAQQNRTNAGAMIVNGTLATGGIATLDRPRNLIAKSGGADTAVLTCTGVDEYGATMSEALTLNGTTAVNGKKAFKKVTAIAANAAVANTAFVGTGNVLGFPVFIPHAGVILKEMENGTAATAGTLVTGYKTAGGSTTTSADVRGTYVPNSTTDADKVFQLIVSLPDAGDKGSPQS